MSTQVLQVLPERIRSLILGLPEEIRQRLEEIRLRMGRPLEVITPEKAWFVGTKGGVVEQAQEAYLPSMEDCHKMLNRISNHSLYALEEELRRGYVTIAGGHRIGLTGKVVVEGGQVKHLRDITGFNLRIARQIRGVAKPLVPYIFQGEQVENVLLISPPQCGKTTYLRDLARIASVGITGRSYKVGIVDERSEIAGCVAGVPSREVGPRTDVLDGCPKAEGMMMMIRSMSPDILVVDEIGRLEDSEAIHDAIYAGVRLFSTAHGRTLEEICRRPTLAGLLREEVFTRLVLLSRRRGPGTIEGVFDGRMRRLSPMAAGAPC